MSSVRLSEDVGMHLLSEDVSEKIPALCRYPSPTRDLNEVRVRLNVFDVMEISITAHRYTCDFFMEVSWTDKTLVDLEDVSSQDVDQWEQQFPYRRPKAVDGVELHWTPRLCFGNVIELTNREEWIQVYTESQPVPVVCYRMRALGTFRERFELHNFPFDSQDLQILIVSMFAKKTGVSEDDMKTPTQARVVSRRSLDDLNSFLDFTLVKNPSSNYQAVVPFENFLLRDEYDMSPVLGEQRSFTSASQSSTRKVYVQLTLSMKICRRPLFYVWNIVLPMFLLVALGFPVHLLETNLLAERLGLVFTLVLAALAYKSWISDNLPKCSYLTLLDKYVIACIVFLAIFAVESALVFIVQKHGLGFFGDYVEDVMGIIGFITWICAHGYVWHCHAARMRGGFELPTQLEEEASMNYCIRYGTREEKPKIA